MGNKMINYLIGDAVKPQYEGFKVIIHCVNNIGFLGSGFSGAIKEKYPEVREKYYEWSKYKILLGELLVVFIKDDLCIANLVAQNGIISRANPKSINYSALLNAMKKLDNWLKSLMKARYFISMKRDMEKISIHCPRLGSGLSRGSWEVVESLILTAWKDFDVYIYDLRYTL